MPADLITPVNGVLTYIYFGENTELAKRSVARAEAILADGLRAAGFSLRSAAITFASDGGMSVNQTTVVYNTDTGTHLAASGEVKLGGLAASTGEAIPNEGVYTWNGTALLRTGDTQRQLSAASGDRAEAAANDAENTVDARIPGFRVEERTPPGMSIAFVSPSNRRILGGIKEDASWLIQLAKEAIIPPEALENVLPDVMQGFSVEALPDTTEWSHIIKSGNGFTLGSVRRADGRLRLALTEDSQIPVDAFSGDITSIITSLMIEKRMAPVSERIYGNGDSLGAGAGGGGVNPIKVMAETLGLSYVNAAVGGTKTASIGVRQGGVPMVISLADDLPANTSEVDVATYSEEFTNNQSNQTIQGRLIFSDNTPDLLVTLRRYGTAADPAITQKYTIARRTAGSESIEIPPDTIFLSDQAYGNELDFHYIQAGQNDDKSTRAKRVQLRDYILQMVDRIGHDRFCIVGQKYVSVAEAAAGSQKRLFNQELQDTFGDHFMAAEVDYMGSQKLFDDMGITPTSEDLTYIAAGAVGPSLRVDPVHGNATYYTAQGRFWARWHRARGWYFKKGA